MLVVALVTAPFAMSITTSTVAILRLVSMSMLVAMQVSMLIPP